LKDEKDMVKQVDGLDIQEQRRVTVLFENYCGPDRRFQTMDFVSFNNLAERPHRTALPFPVVRHPSQPTLHLRRCAQTLNEFPFFRREGFTWRRYVHGKAIAEATVFVSVRSPRVSKGKSRQTRPDRY
jgi:hypothetical protein